MNRKRVLIISLSVLVSLMVFGAAFMTWWIHTPLYALQQAGFAIVQHQPKQFQEVVDVETIVTLLTEEVLYTPAVQTPGLSEFQRYVASGAIVTLREKIDNALINKIDSWVSKSKAYRSDESPLHPPLRTVYAPHRFIQADAYNIEYATADDNNELAVEDGYSEMEPYIVPVADQGGLDWRGLARTVGKELKTEQEDVKHLVARRMYEYAYAHQDTFVGRIFSNPRQERARFMKSLVTEYGFQPSNFKKLYLHRDQEKEICTAEFFCPKRNALVPISVELIPIDPSALLSKWRIVRIWKPKDTLRALGEDTDQQIQEMVAYSLQDVTSRNAWQRTGNLLKRIGEQDVTKRFLQRLNSGF